MTKKLLIILLCAVLMIPAPTTYASKYTEFENVELKDRATGLFKLYEPINVMNSGIDIFSDAPGIIMNGRALLPVSAVLKELGIMYQWNAATEEISFAYGGKNVVMQVDNAYATIGGVKTALPNGVSPKIMTYKNTSGELIGRTYVPLAFISDVLGLNITWIEATRTVAINKKAQTLTGAYLDYKKQFPEIRLKVSGKVDTTSFVIGGADVGEQDKIVVDLQNTAFKLPAGTSVKNGVWTYKIADGIFGLDKVEISQTNTNPLNTRVVVYQNERRGHDISYDAKTGEMVIRLINTVNSVNVQQIFSTDTVVIGTSESPMYNPQIKGNQLIVDIVSSYLKVNSGAYQVLPVNKGKIETISYQQLDKSKFGVDYLPTDVITRVIIELSEPVTYDDFYVEDSGSQVLVYISNNPINNFDYVKQSNERGVMNINLFGKTTYTSKYDAASRKITMEIPKDKTDLGSFEQGINDNIIEKFVVSETASTYKIEATLAENTKYVEASSSSAIVLNFTNTVIRDSLHKETLIVIDAGHGGKDPGAVGTKTQEKILTLKAAKMLESELLKQGFKVYMTRSTDEYVGLYDRATIANDLDATLFVSVHINAFTNSAVSGIEVFYGDDSLTSDKGLAKSIQTELIKALGAVDRDIESKPRLVVLQETKMTSVLAELGFISNPEEQDKMMSEAYLQKAAEAMSRGIINFLK